MSESEEINKKNFLYPHSRYYGEFSPETLIFNANLQDFAQSVSFIAGLHTGGKISSEQAYAEVERLWETFKQTQKNWGRNKEK